MKRIYANVFFGVEWQLVAAAAKKPVDTVKTSMVQSMIRGLLGTKRKNS